MSLCGSGKGARFTTIELLSICNAVQALDGLYGEVDASYKAIKGANPKKIKGLLNKTEPLTLEDVEGDETSLAPLQTFVSASRAYLKNYAPLVVLVSSKRAILLKEIEQGTAMPVENDPEAEMKLASPLPAYLSTLMKKYDSETSPKKPHSSALSDSLARFSAFLAHCIVNMDYMCIQDEVLCLEELLSGSDDGELLDDEAHPRTDDYWRSRIFNFLKVMRELKSVPKKEKDLGAKWDWEGGGGKVEKREKGLPGKGKAAALP